MLNKLKYGFSRLFEEFFGQQDYWHIKFNNRNICEITNRNLYFLDVSAKADYPFELNKGIPVVKISDKKTFFVITILFYGLGLIDRFILSMKKEDSDKILLIYQWLIDNQSNDGSWIVDFEDMTYNLKPGWISGMAQGLAISFLIRCIKLDLVDKNDTDNVIELAKKCMLSSRILNSTIHGDVIEEYEGTNTNVLNGFIFSIYGLYDYGLYTNNMSLFNTYEKVLCEILKTYKFFIWSRYDTKKTIASRFYHNLHIDMMKSLYGITNNNIYLKYFKRWKLGDKLFPFFVICKAIQKFSSLNKIDTLDR